MHLAEAFMDSVEVAIIVAYCLNANESIKRLLTWKLCFGLCLAFNDIVKGFNHVGGID